MNSGWKKKRYVKINIIDKFYMNATDKYELELLFLSHVSVGTPYLLMRDGSFAVITIVCYTVRVVFTDSRRSESRNGKSIYDLSSGLG